MLSLLPAYCYLVIFGGAISNYMEVHYTQVPVGGTLDLSFIYHADTNAAPQTADPNRRGFDIHLEVIWRNLLVQ